MFGFNELLLPIKRLLCFIISISPIWVLNNHSNFGLIINQQYIKELELHIFDTLIQIIQSKQNIDNLSHIIEIVITKSKHEI